MSEVTNDINGIKIWNMDDCDWYAGRSLDEACALYKEHTGEMPDPENVSELSSDDLDRLKFIVDEPNRVADPKRISFREQLQNLVDAGETFPFYFASTEY